MSFFDQYLQNLKSLYPETTSRHLDVIKNLPATLVCSENLPLPTSVLHDISKTVDAFFELRNSSLYQSHALAQVRDQLPVAFKLESLRSPNFSALMSYDFHLAESGQLKLIEINTNASQSLILDLGFRTQGLTDSLAKGFMQNIVDTFQSEFRLFEEGKRATENNEIRTEKTHAQNQTLKTVAIVDEKPLDQKMYLEFLLYQELFNQHGIRARVCDPSELVLVDSREVTEGKSPGHLLASDKVMYFKDDTNFANPIDLIYNRLTDFYFSDPLNNHLLDAVVHQSVCITPHPFEYLLLADKERLFEISHQPQLLQSFSISKPNAQAIQSVLIPTLSVNDQLKEDLWANRKKYFFKPKRSFGGKAAYRGSSVSRGTFENILKGDYIAQEFVPPGTRHLQNSDNQEFKFDLRAYVYRNEVQLVGARFYQGQMTNSQTIGGGMAPVVWE